MKFGCLQEWMAVFFDYRGLRYWIFFDWDVEGRAASGKEDPFLYGSGLRDFEGGASKAGWGRLKSGIGWVSLDFCQRL